MSFADELRELALTAPKEKDSEDVFNEESNAKLSKYDSSTYERVDGGKSAVLLNDKKYAGKMVSRKEFFDVDDEDDMPDEQFELNPNLYDVVGDDDEDSGEDVAQEDDEQDEEDSGDEDGDEEDDMDAESGDEDEDEEEDIDISNFAQAKQTANGDGGDVFDDLEAQHDQSKPPLEDIRKEKSIANQMKIWDKLLEYRIQFHRLLALSNQLPPFSVYKDEMKEFLAVPENKRIFRQSVKNVEKAFEQLAAIRQELVRKYPELRKALEGKADEEEMGSDDEEIPSDIASGYSDNDGDEPVGSKRKSRVMEVDEEDEERSPAKKFKPTEAGKDNAEFHEKLHKFRNATIDKWYQRTKLASGKTSKGYTALEQPPVKQIEQILEDQDRLLERTRTKRGQYHIIGIDESEFKKADGLSTKVVNPEIFDDDDFYHHLLREVIERKTQDITDPLEISRHWIEVQKLRTKTKRRIDTKASKGRKIRFDVIPELVNFMTPHDASTFSEQAKNDLVASIFGKRPAVDPKVLLHPEISKKDLVDFKLFS